MSNTENFNEQRDEDMSKYLVGTKILLIVASIIGIAIITALVSCSAKAQSINFSAGIDVRNAIIGSEPTNDNPELDLLLSCRMVSNKDVVISIQYETFKAISFTKYSFTLGYQFNPLNKINFTPNLEFGVISRKDFSDFKGEGSFFTVGCNFILEYDLSDSFNFGVNTNISHRTDLDYMYGGKNYILSNFIVLTYVIPIGNYN